jgi:hypothetical protein
MDDRLALQLHGRVVGFGAVNREGREENEGAK